MEASIPSGSLTRPQARVSATREGFLRVSPAGTCRAAAGFTLLELIVVVSIILILLSVAAPVYRNSIIRAKEAVLRDQLFMMRQLIDEYTLDKQKAPKMLEDLVEGRYLREIPRDPFTGSNTTWQVIMEDTMMAVDQTEPGIVDVKSGSERISLDGTPYNTW